MPTADQIEDLTDGLAARIALNLAGYANELGASTNPSVAAQLDAIGDHYLEAALMTAALAADAQSLPENYKTALPHILGRPGYANLISAWQAYVLSEGAYASFDAMIADAGASLHPLAAELIRNTQGDGALSAANVFAPYHGCIAPVRVYQGADGSLSEETVDAGDVGTADITLFASDDHALYIGCNSKFSALVIALSTLANTSITPTFQYWNGSAWATLAVTDNTTGLTLNDVITWTAPANWQRCSADAGGTDFADLTPRYYLRIARTTNTVSQVPVGSMIWCVPAATLNASGAHLGTAQPPLGIGVVRGSGTIVMLPYASVAYDRWTPPAIGIRALTPGLGTGTITASYVDQGGDDATQAQSALTSPVAGDTVAVTLAGGDTGARAVNSTGWVVSGGSRGVFEIYAAEERTPAL